MATKTKAKQKIAKENGVTLSMVLVIVTAVVIVLILTSIKIYLSNKIYYESKEVNRMTREVSVLEAEKVMLTHSVEALRFKNNVTDTIFSIHDSE